MTSNIVDVAGRGYETQLRVIPGLLIIQIDIFDMSGDSNNQVSTGALALALALVASYLKI
jgi:hypothetical protein